MKEGERAVLHVPPSKGYGAQSQGSKGGGWYIPGNSNLHFDIEILGAFWRKLHAVYCVPLIIRTPGGKKGRVVPELVQVFDIVPIMLDLANITARHVHFGKSLVSSRGRFDQPTFQRSKPITRHDQIRI